mmetsp:Transcript_72126/g.116989  ORF Transcript_72126/g.116989 Transcript_72126/m.116989 type:complete len:212 (-) Transcript_72126:119-754(-)
MQIGVNFAVGKQPAEFVVINQPRTVLVHFPHELVNINRQLRAACKRLQFVYTDLPLGSRAASKDFKSSSHIRRIAILLRLLEEPFPAHHCKLSEVDAHIRVFHFARRSDHLYYHLVSYLMTACEEERLAQLPKVHVSQQWVSEDVFAPAIDRRIKIAEAMEAPLDDFIWDLGFDAVHFGERAIIACCQRIGKRPAAIAFPPLPQPLLDLVW